MPEDPADVLHPLVTVVAVCYNHARFVEECLDSIAALDYPNVELIVTDDASTDDSARVIKEWIGRHWPTAVFVAHEQNRGLCATLNEVLALSSGKYLSLIATDDVLEPKKLTEQVGLIESAGDDVAMVYSNVYVMDEDGLVRDRTYAETEWSFDTPPDGKIFDDLLKGNFVPALSVLLRRSAVIEVGGYDESLLHEDWDMWLRLGRRFRACYSPYISAKYRVVSTSLYRTRRVELAESKIRSLSRWLDEPEYRERVIDQIRLESHYIYMADRKRGIPYLKLMCELRRNYRTRGRYVLARLGVNYRVQQRLAALFHRRRGRSG